MATTGSPQVPDGPFLTLVIMTIVFRVAMAIGYTHKEQFYILSHLAI